VIYRNSAGSVLGVVRSLMMFISLFPVLLHSVARGVGQFLLFVGSLGILVSQFFLFNVNA
jgi:hypothetical protein